MRLAASVVLATVIVATMVAGCAGTASQAASPTELATSPLVGTPEPTTVPTTSPSPGSTLIPYPGPSIPPGTPTIEIRAVAHLTFDRTTLSAPADRPFVIHFANQDDIGGQYEVPAAHNVAIKMGNVLLFNPLPAIFAPATADYFISEGLPAGTYRFLCTVHPLMNGALTVQ